MSPDANFEEEKKLEQPQILLQVVFRIHRIHMFLGLADQDPLVRCMDPDPDPSISKQK